MASSSSGKVISMDERRAAMARAGGPASAMGPDPSSVIQSSDASPIPIRTYSTSIVDLGRFRLRWPITVVLEEWDSEFVATWPEVEAWASGRTDFEAVDALKEAISELYEDLSRSEDASLGRAPRRWKRALASAVLVPGEP